MREKTILECLTTNEQYSRQVLPFLKIEYFHDHTERALFSVIEGYIKKYNGLPVKTALEIELDKIIGISDTQHESMVEYVKEMGTPDVNLSWAVDNTEKWCQDKAVYNAVMDSIKIIEDNDKSLSRNSIPEILSSALSVSFDNSIGHDFLEDTSMRYDFYHRVEERIPFDLDYFNKITKGGLSRKSLNIALAGTGVGKSLFMCHCAANNLMMGKNVLYITMEMSEEKIAERIDANLLDVMVDELAVMPKDAYDKKVGRIKNKTNGKLIIKEYPTASAGSTHFRHLLNELKIKRNFTPDIIYIDYLNICMSSRLRSGGNVNSYSYVKAIAEELRGLAVEFNVPVVSATQTTRSGYASSDVGLEDTSESFGLPATADFMFALISTDELQQVNQMMVKQLKNRYADPSAYKRFIIGVDRAKMKLYDVEVDQQNIMGGPDKDDKDDVPLYDRSKFDRSKLNSLRV
jgi:archaellum biogenesis ATPase FlaH